MKWWLLCSVKILKEITVEGQTVNAIYRRPKIEFVLPAEFNIPVNISAFQGDSFDQLVRRLVKWPFFNRIMDFHFQPGLFINFAL